AQLLAAGRRLLAHAARLPLLESESRRAGLCQGQPARIVRGIHQLTHDQHARRELGRRLLDRGCGRGHARLRPALDRSQGRVTLRQKSTTESAEKRRETQRMLKSTLRASLCSLW